MTGTDQLLAALAGTGPILLDFDGPMTLLLPPPANADLAVAARKSLTDAGVVLPPEITHTTDHLAVLRFAGRQPLHIARAVELVCIAAEIHAARTSRPSHGAHDAIRAFSESGRPIVVVTNNATAAVDAHLERHNLTSLISATVGRPFGQPGLMKPHPRLVDTALALLDTTGSECVLIGDSVTDVQAARHAGARCVGYAKSPARGAELLTAGADAIVDDMQALIPAIHQVALLN